MAHPDVWGGQAHPDAQAEQWDWVVADPAIAARLKGSGSEHVRVLAADVFYYNIDLIGKGRVLLTDMILTTVPGTVMILTTAPALS